MCGLIAMIDWTETKFNAKDMDLFKNLLIINSLRGSNSTGAFGINKNTLNVDYAKTVGSPYMFLGSKSGKKFVENMYQRYGAVAAHGRYATSTRGRIVAENAHPFQHNHITMIHNGHISNVWELEKDHKIPKQDVDSHTATILFGEIGVIEGLKKVRGAFAFIIFDSKSKTLQIVRNDERPLYMVRRKDKHQAIISSEIAMLEFATTRENLPILSIQEIAPKNLYTFYLDSKEPHWDKEKVEFAPAYQPQQQQYHPYSEVEMAEYEREEIVRKPVAALFTKPKTIPTDKLKLVVGERVLFFPTKSKEMVPGDKTKAIERTFIEGTLVKEDDVLVTAVYEGDFSPFLGEELLSGEIMRIWSTKIPAYKYRIMLTDLKPEPVEALEDEAENVTIITEQPKRITGGDLVNLLDTQIVRWRAVELVQKGCVRCKAKLNMNTLQFMVTTMDPAPIGYGLLCPKCTGNNMAAQPNAQVLH